MPERMPVVFVSHGAPDALLKAPDTVNCWRRIGQQVLPPSAILVVSAHWEAGQPTASLSGAPQTIHDFGGFPAALYQMQYPAPGAPALAERAVALLSHAGVGAHLHPDRGLDHGAWVPLSAMFPQANVPVTQLSLARKGGAAAHVALGQALASLRDEGVLILASGSITHNFGWLDWHADGDRAPMPKASQFAEWVADRLAAQDVASLLAYRSAPPYGAEAHPSEEHFLPLFVALGAAAGDAPQRHQPRFTYGGLAMDAYVWRDRQGQA
ncbi:MAG: class III extradiol ring-cleavage dioxygenase [Thiobacillaceae bacterium]